MLDILLAEDNPGDVLLVKHALEEDQIRHDLHIVDDGAATLGVSHYFRKPMDFDAFMQLGAVVLKVVEGNPA